MSNKKPLKVIAGTSDRPLIIGDIEIPCYVLEDETRVLSQRGFLKAIGRSGAQSSAGDGKLPVFMASERIKPFISKALAATLNPVEFQPPDGGRSAYGYHAKLLPQVCEVYLKARDAGVLLSSQLHVAERADILIRGLAAIGIIALVDEATGYQKVREECALAKELQPWTKTFPYEFYQQIFRRKGWPGPDGIKRPAVIGHYTNNFIYERLAPGVLDELRQKNPVMPSGHRSSRHHQWFTPDTGNTKLREHLAAVIALMRAAPNWGAFKRSLNRAFPKWGETMELRLED